MVGGEFVSVSNSGQRYPTRDRRLHRLSKALSYCPPGLTIAIINSVQDYKINASIDVHQQTPNTHMYWIPGNMMLNAISGIAPIS